MKKLFNLMTLGLIMMTGSVYGQVQTFNTQVKMTNVSQNNTNTQILSRNPTTNILEWVEKSTIGGVSAHNSLIGLQGGTTNQYYHLTQAQLSWIQSQMYTNNTSSFNVSPLSGERGVNTAININYNIASNDDIITSANINQGIGSVLGNVNSGNQTISAGTKTSTTTFILTLNYTRQGAPLTETKTSQYQAYIPQWAGNSSLSDFTGDYVELTNSGLQKYIQLSSSITKAFTSGTYAYFLVTSNTGTITGNGFTYSIGNWGDTESFFWKKSINLTLSDGTVATNVYLIRSREQITGNITFIHN